MSRRACLLLVPLSLVVLPQCGDDPTTQVISATILSFVVDPNPTHRDTELTFRWSVHNATSVLVTFDGETVCQSQLSTGSCTHAGVDQLGSYVAALVAEPGARRETTVAVQARREMRLLSMVPVSGSSIPYAAGTTLATGRVSITFDQSGTYGLFAGMDPAGYQGGDSCVCGAMLGDESFDLVVDEPRMVGFYLSVGPCNQPTTATPCEPPFSVDGLTVDLNYEPHTGTPALRGEFDVSYRFE